MYVYTVLKTEKSQKSYITPFLKEKLLSQSDVLKDSP